MRVTYNLHPSLRTHARRLGGQWLMVTSRLKFHLQPLERYKYQGEYLGEPANDAGGVLRRASTGAFRGRLQPIRWGEPLRRSGASH